MFLLLPHVQSCTIFNAISEVITFSHISPFTYSHAQSLARCSLTCPHKVSLAPWRRPPDEATAGVERMGPHAPTRNISTWLSLSKSTSSSTQIHNTTGSNNQVIAFSTVPPFLRSQKTTRSLQPTGCSMTGQNVLWSSKIWVPSPWRCTRSCFYPQHVCSLFYLDFCLRPTCYRTPIPCLRLGPH